MQAIILTAGEGARLRGYTTNRPKGMIPLANRPILEHLVYGLKAAGVRRCVMVVGYGVEAVMSYFGDGDRFGLEISYAQQPKPLGTVDALRVGRQGLDDETLVIPGDNYLSPGDFRQLVKLGPPGLLAGQAERWSKWGCLEPAGRGYRLTLEYPDAIGRIHFTGIAHLSVEQVSAVIETGERHLTSALAGLLADGSFQPAVAMAEGWHNIVYPWDLVRGNQVALKEMSQHREGTVETGVTIRGSMSLGRGSIIRAGCYFVGPVTVGEGCEIGPMCVLGPDTAIGDNVILGPHVEIINSQVMEGSTVGSFTHLESSVVGMDCTLGPHCIAVPGVPETIYQGRLYSVIGLGTNIGDSCRVGARVILQGGSVLYRGVSVADAATVQGEIPANTRLV